MGEYILYTVNKHEILLNKLKSHDNLSHLHGNLTINTVGKTFVYQYNFEEKEYLEDLANVVSDIMQQEVILELANKYISSLKDISDEIKSEIKKNFILNNYLLKEEGSSYLSYYFIYLPILQQLKNHRVLHIDGWIQFRLKEYKMILKDIINTLIAQQKMKERFNSFIDFIKEIVFLKNTIEEELHIIYLKNHKVKFLNSNRYDLTKEYIEEYCFDCLADYDMCMEDIVMNVCIALCPHLIVIHQKKNCKKMQFFKTLESIFENKIKYCNGCEHCSETDSFTDRKGIDI